MASSVVFTVLLTLAIAIPLSQASDPTLEEYKAGKVAKADAAAAAVAVEKKMAAIDKVVTMMKNIRDQVQADGDAEAASYNKFACFCADTQKAKNEAITKGTDDKTDLTAAINKLSTERDGLDTKIGTLEGEIADTKKSMKKAKDERASTNAVYMTNEQDTSAAIFALEKAIESLKASKSSGSASLLQVQSVGKTVRTAMLLADALGLIHAENRKVASLFLQTADEPPEVEMEDYKFHSSDIIATLEKLEKDFKATKVDLDTTEVKSVQDFQMLMQDLTDTLKAKTQELQTTKAARDQAMADIALNSQELSVTASTLLDDQKYLEELNELCAGKAKTWDQRNSLRADELTTLTAVLGILEQGVKTKVSAVTMRLVQQGRGKINFGVYASENVAKSDSDMEALEAVAESEEEEVQDGSPVAFLQRRKQQSVRPHAKMNGRLAVGAMLKSEGVKLKSTLLTALATRIQSSADPFAKIKVLIQEMIDRLLAEESSEANKKGDCDKKIADSTQKRTYSAEKVEVLNAKLADQEATRDTLAEQIAELQVEIDAITDEQDTADAQRNLESTTNNATVTEAKEGLAAVKMAIDIIDKFYKTKAKAEVESFAQGPAGDAPDAGFKNFEAYKGAQAESGGIIGMMDVIKSDFERTISETLAAEAQAEADHLAFMTETSKSKETKKTAQAEKNKIKMEVDASILADKTSLETQMEILKTSVTELITWKAECIDTGMSYDSRVANREDEIADLKKALCILENYEEYGEGAEASTC